MNGPIWLDLPHGHGRSSWTLNPEHIWLSRFPWIPDRPTGVVFSYSRHLWFIHIFQWPYLQRDILARKSMTHLALFLFLERHLLTNMVFFSLINSGSGKTSLAKSSAFPQQSDNKAFQRTSPVPVYVHWILIVVYAVFLWLINCTWIHWYFNYCSAISTLPLRLWLRPGGTYSP